jgi:hypothetical protein
MNKVLALPDGDHINYCITPWLRQTGFDIDDICVNKGDYIDDVKNNIFGITEELYHSDYLIMGKNN